MNTNAQYAAGIDSGSASTDAVILDRSGKICGWAIVPTGAGAATGARQALEQALTMAGIAESDLGSKVYTGYHLPCPRGSSSRPRRAHRDRHWRAGFQGDPPERKRRC